MTKKTERIGDPVVAQVPWGAMQTPEPSMDEHTLAATFEQMPDAEPIFEPPEQNAEQIKSAFTGEPIAQRSPFAPKPKANVAPAEETFDLGDAPSWGDLVRFVQKHGDTIIQVRYPRPLGEAIDTIYRGVTVLKHPTCEVRHKHIGWIDWQAAQYE